MARDPNAFLWDVRTAADAIARYTAGKSLEDFLNDDMLRSAVERQFEIIGEALAQLAKLDSQLLSRIPDAGNAIGFRNVLIHGYAKIDSGIVWEAATKSLPRLRASVDFVLDDVRPDA
jgi:uncharacterized protein with HEPN domain